MLVRSPDAVMGVGFVVVFPLTFSRNAFVPIESLPNVLAVGRVGEPDQRAGRRSPQAVRQPGGAGDQARLAARSSRSLPRGCTAWSLVALGCVIAQRRYQARTTD